jgi:hypothetical protein
MAGIVTIIGSIMQLNGDYTSREKALWRAATDFANKINAALDADPTLLLFYDGSAVKTGIRLEFLKTDAALQYTDYWICITEENYTQGVFSINESEQDSLDMVTRKLKNSLKLYKEVLIEA